MILINIISFVKKLKFSLPGVGIKKLYRLYNKTGEVMTRQSCCNESAIMYFCQTLGLYVATTLAIDRTVSFLKPIEYKSMTPGRLTYPLIILAWGLSILETVVMIGKV